MARAELVATEVTNGGVGPPLEVDGDPVEGHYFVNDTRSKTMLSVRNAGAAAHIATVRVNQAAVNEVLERNGISIAVSVTDTEYALDPGEAVDVAAVSATVYNQTEDPDALGETAAVYVDVDSADLKLQLRLLA